MIKLVKEAYSEFEKVTWPNKQDTIRLTGYVIGVSLLVGLFVSGVDYAFTHLLGIIL